MRSFSTDRPTKSNVPYTVDAGHFQYEGDIFIFGFDNTTTPDTDNRTWVIGNPTFKLGLLDNGQTEQRITKLMDPAEATGEYIGVTLIEGDAAEELADALKTTFERDPDLYYEDGYQELVNRGGRIGVAPIGEVDWVEVDNHDDLEKARRIAKGY